MNDKTVKSPITGRDAVFVEDIPVQTIIDNYRKLLDLDVHEYFIDLDAVKVYQCPDTGFRFYHPPTIFADGDFYAELQKKDFYYSSWNWEHRLALKNIAPGSKILEVGCGTGSFMERLQKLGFTVTGLELNIEAARACHRKGLMVYNEMLDVHLQTNSGKYDAVCAFQVLEHVYHAGTFIRECLQALKPGGTLIVAVPNNNPYYHKYDKYNTLNLPPHHAGMWSKEAFEKLPLYFPVKEKQIAVEPLFNREAYLSVYMNHKRLSGFYNKLRKIGPGIINRLLWPIRFFVPGKCLVAIFKKETDQQSSRPD